MPTSGEQAAEEGAAPLLRRVLVGQGVDAPVHMQLAAVQRQLADMQSLAADHQRPRAGAQDDALVVEPLHVLHTGYGELFPSLQLEGREKLTVAGVEDVERFDDQCIVLRTGAGTLVVSGEGLHIGKLSLDGGELHVDGRIDALTYEDAPEERGGSFFSRLFA